MAEAVKHIPYEEFTSDPASVFERVVSKHETILVERGSDSVVLVRPVQVDELSQRKRTAQDHQAFLSSFGSWSEDDADTLSKNVYESRKMPPRPQVEL